MRRAFRKDFCEAMGWTCYTIVWTLQIWGVLTNCGVAFTESGSFSYVALDIHRRIKLVGSVRRQSSYTDQLNNQLKDRVLGQKTIRWLVEQNIQIRIHTTSSGSAARM